MFSYSGRVFGPEDALWSYVAPGDRIVVLGCCQFGAWDCKGKYGYLQTWKFYDPECHPPTHETRRLQPSPDDDRVSSDGYASSENE